MKTIYVIFSSTDLRIGRMIRFVTQNEYNHCSVCLREDLSIFYSFSRIYKNNPLIGGFTVESPLRYTLSPKTRLKIVSVPVSDCGFDAVSDMISEMSEDPENYVYNYFSAVIYPFGKRFERDNAFTCAEFTSRLLKVAGVPMPKKANIEEMENALKELPTWEGRAVDGRFDSLWGEDRYLDRIGKRRQCALMAKRFRRLVAGRMQAVKEPT